MDNPLIQGKNLTMWYEKQSFLFKNLKNRPAINEISISIFSGKSIALIGESGSGKSTIGKILAGLIKPSGGEVFFKGENISEISLSKMRPYRKNIQIIFQNSTGIFNPKDTIGDSIGDAISNYENLSKKTLSEKVEKILSMMGLDGSYMKRFPHEISGGQRQRANIARALALNPEFVICDEPISSLDYCLRNQIISLLSSMKESFGITYLLITHDLSTIKKLCDGVVILYSGSIVEQLDFIENFEERICHPYTKQLFDSIPTTNPSKRKNINLNISFEQNIYEEGCVFYSRCSKRSPECRYEKPKLRKIENGHFVACHKV